MHKKYKIAGLNVFIKDCYNEDFFTKRYAAYQADFEDNQADFTLESKIVENMTLPTDGELLFDTPGQKLYKLPNSNFVHVKIRSKDNYIVEIIGGEIKPHGVEKLGEVNLKTAIVKTGLLRKAKVTPRVLDAEKSDDFKVTFLDHAGEDVYKQL